MMSMISGSGTGVPPGLIQICCGVVGSGRAREERPIGRPGKPGIAAPGLSGGGSRSGAMVAVKRVAGEVAGGTCPGELSTLAGKVSMVSELSGC